MLDQKLQQVLDEKQDEILTGMPVPQDGKIGDIRTNVAHKGKFYQTMKVGIDTHFFSAPFSQVPSIHTMGDYLLKSGGKMLNGSLIDAYDVTARNGLTLPGLSPGDAVLVLDGTGKVVPDENLTWDGSELVLIGSQDIMHTAPEADDHALEIDCNAAGFGDVKAIDIAYITGAIAAGQDEGVILVNIDESLATGGDVFALAVLATEGSAGIYGLKAGALVGPIHQDSGVFANMDSALVNAVGRRAEFISSASDIAIFVADNDTVTIGHAAKFEEIEFLLATVASGSGIKPTFEYSTGGGPTTWATFTPVDGTNGMKNTGVIAWDDADIPSWAVDGNSEYLIRITRTKNNLTTVPVEDKVQIASTTTYEWDKSGDLSIRDISGRAAVLTGTLKTGGNYSLEGYATGRNVIRAVSLDISPGDTPGTNIDVTYDAGSSSDFNVPTITNAADLTAGGSSGSFALSADGKYITLDLTEAVVGALGVSCPIHDINSSSTTEMYFFTLFIVGANLRIYVRKRGSTTTVSWLTIMDAGDYASVLVQFVTSS